MKRNDGKYYIARNKDGRAKIFLYNPMRCSELFEEEKTFWGNPMIMDGQAPITDDKLKSIVGFDITWDNEPIEIFCKDVDNIDEERQYMKAIIQDKEYPYIKFGDVNCSFYDSKFATREELSKEDFINKIRRV